MNNITENQIKNMPDYMLQTRINGQFSNENNDAALISLTSIILAVSTFILAASFLKYIIIAAFILLIIQYFLSFINIYIRFHPKYAVGNSYITRKFYTAAVPYYIYSLIIPYIIYDHGLMWIGAFFLPFLFSSPLINGLWRTFDSLKYSKIDSKLPTQKRSFFESEKLAMDYHLCRKELALREINRHSRIARDLDDIIIKKKESTDGI